MNDCICCQWYQYRAMHSHSLALHYRITWMLGKGHPDMRPTEHWEMRSIFDALRSSDYFRMLSDGAVQVQVPCS